MLLLVTHPTGRFKGGWGWPTGHDPTHRNAEKLLHTLFFLSSTYKIKIFGRKLILQLYTFVAPITYKGIHLLIGKVF